MKTKIMALICIVNPALEDRLIEKLYENNVHGINILLGHGARKFGLLEFEHNHKSVVVSFIKAEAEQNIIQMLKDENFVEDKNGIAFTVNIDAAAGGNIIFGFYDKIQAYLEEKNLELIVDEKHQHYISVKPKEPKNDPNHDNNKEPENEKDSKG